MGHSASDHLELGGTLWDGRVKQLALLRCIRWRSEDGPWETARCRFVASTWTEIRTPSQLAIRRRSSRTGNFSSRVLCPTSLLVGGQYQFAAKRFLRSGGARPDAFAKSMSSKDLLGLPTNQTNAVALYPKTPQPTPSAHHRVDLLDQ